MAVVGLAAATRLSSSFTPVLLVVVCRLTRDGHIGHSEDRKNECLYGSDKDSIRHEDGVPDRSNPEADRWSSQVRPDDEKNFAGNDVAEETKGQGQRPGQFVDDAEEHR